MRKRFFELLYQEMQKNPDIWLVTGDLGYRQMDEIRQDFPERFVNVGAAETCGLDVCVGLSLSGKIPFWYSITTFAIYRPFEVIRTYIDHENIPVKIIGGGRNKDYEIDGFSHDASDDRLFMRQFDRFNCLWPRDNQELEQMFPNVVKIKEPFYVNVKRG